MNTKPRQAIFGVDRSDDVAIVRPLCDISSLADVNVRAEFADVLDQLKTGAVTKVVVDLEGSSYFGSTMLEAMLLLWKRVREQHGGMALCNVSQIGKDVLSVTQFDKLWQVCPSRDEALEAVRAPAE